LVAVAGHNSFVYAKQQMPGKRGLYDNIHAKRKAGKKPRKPGSKGAPTNADFKAAAKTANKLKIY
tara:strand:+ start:2447 stop:2641 length:195 start_codon:yes stop_codon:yes gene_type:complete